MFLGYCLNPSNDTWTPPVHLATAQAAYWYCCLHHDLVPEIRITDSGDNIVLHMRDHVLYVPYPDGTLQAIPITPAFIAAVQAAEE